MPYDALVEKNMKKSRADVFAALMDFGALASFLPDVVKSCECIGDDVGAQRNIVFHDGAALTERLDAAFDQQFFAYSIVGESPLPFENYVSVVTLEDTAAGGCIASWGSNWTPKDGADEDDVRTLVEGFYSALLGNIDQAEG